MLPYGYTVSLILCFIPPVWKKVIDPYADAANKGEKLSLEMVKYLEKWILGTLCMVSLALTYITFIAIGFESRDPY